MLRAPRGRGRGRGRDPRVVPAPRAPPVSAPGRRGLDAARGGAAPGGVGAREAGGAAPWGGLGLRLPWSLVGRRPGPSRRPGRPGPPVINSRLDGGRALGGPLSAPASPASDTAREPGRRRESPRTSLACPRFIFFPDPNAGAGRARVTRCDISNPAPCFLENGLERLQEISERYRICSSPGRARTTQAQVFPAEGLTLWQPRWGMRCPFPCPSGEMTTTHPSCPGLV